ncbi:Serine/threonine protein phosphatase [Desulfovibrio sp. DV]|uniref:metallophosphoesterase family protein n=1 Tax=Desulfovibrio sp. DV TaxID=1844708 RepID=UPI00094B8045|nr:metallophosphoesterase family protein [Desulfovibrio sp. DV]OLN29796.1 Serine/threonine protein phosphatase [Desulfovibrio sp. DV]
MPALTIEQTIFAVGDIHGQAGRLDALLGRLDGLDPTARLVFLGDYIDRGPASRQVVDRLLALGKKRPDTVFLLGNHEAALLRYDASRSPEDLRLLRRFGFQATLDSYASAPGDQGIDFMPREHQDFFRSLKRWHRAGPYVFFHAPLAWDANPDAARGMALEGLLSNRTLPWEGWVESGRTLVFGHVPLETPLVAPGLIGVDTGAGWGRVLTAVELPALRFHHA